MTKKNFKAGKNNIDVKGDLTNITIINFGGLGFLIILIILFLAGFRVCLVRPNQFLKTQLKYHQSSHQEPLMNLSPENTLASTPPHINDYTNEFIDSYSSSKIHEKLSYSTSDSPYEIRDIVVPFTNAESLKGGFSLNSTEINQTNLDNSALLNGTNIFSQDLSKAVMEDLTISWLTQEAATNYGVVTTSVNIPFSLINTQNSSKFSIASFLEEAKINQSQKVALLDVILPELALSEPIVNHFAVSSETSNKGSNSNNFHFSLDTTTPEIKDTPESTPIVGLLMVAILGVILRWKQK